MRRQQGLIRSWWVPRDRPAGTVRLDRRTQRARSASALPCQRVSAHPCGKLCKKALGRVYCYDGLLRITAAWFPKPRPDAAVWLQVLDQRLSVLRTRPALGNHLEAGLAPALVAISVGIPLLVRYALTAAARRSTASGCRYRTGIGSVYRLPRYRVRRAGQSRGEFIEHLHALRFSAYLSKSNRRLLRSRSRQQSLALARTAAARRGRWRRRGGSDLLGDGGRLQLIPCRRQLRGVQYQHASKGHTILHHLTL